MSKIDHTSVTSCASLAMLIIVSASSQAGPINLTVMLCTPSLPLSQARRTSRNLPQMPGVPTSWSATIPSKSHLSLPVSILSGTSLDRLLSNYCRKESCFASNKTDSKSLSFTMYPAHTTLAISRHMSSPRNFST